MVKDNQIQRAREVPIERLMGIEQDHRRLVKCPFHHDKTPSFLIDEENGFHCFGCEAHGSNAIDFCMQFDDTSFVEAVEFLTNNY